MAKPYDFIFKNTDWYNKHFSGYSNPLFVQGFAAVNGVKKCYDFGFNSGVYLYENEIQDWYWDVNELERVRNIITHV